jgi:hypothetical protein
VAFPDHRIEYRWDFDRESHLFRVDTRDGRVKHNTLLSREFVEAVFLRYGLFKEMVDISPKKNARIVTN